jgi:predicted RNA-binding protein YlxR (DUF448 family)
MTSKPKNELVRLVAEDGVPRVDGTGKANGRGVYLCPDETCLNNALKRNALTRGLAIKAISNEDKERIGNELKKLIPDAEV